MKFMSDNGVIFDKMEDCQAFEANPSFLMYDEDGAPTADCDAAMLIEIKDYDGYCLCYELLKKQDSPDRGLEGEPGYYYWSGSEFHFIDKNIFNLFRSIKK